MAHFAYIDKDGISLFQRHLTLQRATTTRREPPMPVAKSLTDVAWAAVSAAAWELVQRKKAETFDAAVDQLKQQSHPSYLTYLASLAPGNTPLPQEQPIDIGKRAAAVVKMDAETHFAKRREVETELQKRATALVRSGQAANDVEAVREVFKRDRDFYNRHRELTYAKGPVVPPPPPDTVTFGPRPVDAQVRQMAQALRGDDPWGQFVGKSEAEMVEEVFKRHPALYQAYTREVMR